jgi:uncharacterized spore protein YtfJ
MTDLSQVLEKARDVVTVKQVFGEPQVQDGVTIIPVARVGTGGGGGGGEGTGAEGEGQGKGYGLGFGLGAEPVGVYVIKDGEVKWQPAVDVNRAIRGGQMVAIVALVTLRAVVKHRARTKVAREKIRGSK